MYVHDVVAEQGAIIRFEYDTINDTLSKAKEHGRVAKDALAIFPETEFKSALMKLVDFSIIRSH